MRHLLIIFLFSLLTLSSSAQEPDSLKVEQPLLKDLFLWGNQIIAEKDRSTTDKFYYCDPQLNKLTRLQIKGNPEISHLAVSKSFLFAIVKNQDDFDILSKEKNNNYWATDKLFEEFNLNDNAKFVATDNLLVLVTAERIYYKVFNSTWKYVEIDKLFDRKSSMLLRESAPQHCLLTNRSLYLGYNYGEWSGALIEIPFRIGKEVVFQKGKRIIRDNIVAMSYFKDSTLWFATGLAHMGVAKSGIYKYEDNKLHQILWTKSSLSLKKESDLSAFYLSNLGIPFFVASELGVFKIEHDSLKQVIEKDLYISYPMKNYTVGSLPEAMFVDNDNNIFIASRSLGVFVYSRNNNSYKFSQLTFD